MTLYLNDFAMELLLCVLSFCPQGDLASFSRVNSTFHHAAEYLLYGHVYISVYSSHRITTSFARRRLFFQTLTSNPQKAALLRSFHLDDHDSIGTNDENVEQTIAILRDAHGLVDLRITFGRPYFHH
ncbi:hypothetical protein M378DRAFT_159776, partial [Amanita muscaria Koide BX008]